MGLSTHVVGQGYPRWERQRCLKKKTKSEVDVSVVVCRDTTPTPPRRQLLPEKTQWELAGQANQTRLRTARCFSGATSSEAAHPPSTNDSFGGAETKYLVKAWKQSQPGPGDAECSCEGRVDSLRRSSWRKGLKPQVDRTAGLLSVRFERCPPLEGDACGFAPPGPTIPGVSTSWVGAFQGMGEGPKATLGVALSAYLFSTALGQPRAWRTLFI